MKQAQRDYCEHSVRNGFKVKFSNLQMDLFNMCKPWSKKDAHTETKTFLDLKLLSDTMIVLGDRFDRPNDQLVPY